MISTTTNHQSRSLQLSQRVLAFAGLGLLLLGPAVPCAAQASEPYTWNSMAIGGGGFVSGIITSKTQAGLMYARTDVGGAYRWDVAAAKWIPLMDFASDQEQGMFGVESLALDPQNPATVYAYCGINYFNSGRTFILRSTDYGATFTQVDVTAQFKAHGNGMGRGNGEKLQVDPNNSTTLYCGTRSNGLWKSTNSGTTWTNLAGLPVTATPNGNGVSFVLLDNTTAVGGATQRVFAGISRNGGVGANFYRSEDAGTTFAAVSNPGLAAGMMPQRAVQAGGNLYLSYGNGSGPYGTTFAATNNLPASAEPYDAGQIWKYNIAAGTWTNLTPTTGVNRAFGGLSVDRINPNRIIISTTNSYQQQGPSSSSPYGDRFFLTTDGGATWTDVVARGFSTNPDGVTWVLNSSIHWAGCIEFDPFVTNRVLVTSGNGIFVNDDITATAGVWKFFVKGLEETVPLNLVSIPAGPVVSVIGDYDGFRHTDAAQYAPIHQPRIGTTRGLSYAALNPNKVVRVGGSTVANTRIFLSTDMGVTWTATATTNGVSGQAALSADGNTLVHSPTASTVSYRSTDNGATWTTCSGLTVNEARPVADAVNSSKFYAYSPTNGAVLVSTDGGATFAQSNATALANNGSKVIRTVPGREGHLWVPLYGGGLTRSTNSGTTFTRVNASALTYCAAVGIGKAALGATYETVYVYGTVGGRVGVYRSTDEGATWVRVNDDAHEYGGPANGQFVVGDMNIYGRVYMSTAGRGVVYGTPTATALAVSPAAKKGLGALIAYPNPATGRVALTLPAALVGGTLSLVNDVGAVVRTEPVLQASHTLDLSRLPAGLYILRAARGGEEATVRLVKE